MITAEAAPRPFQRVTRRGLFTKTIEVGCTVDLEQTNESLHAYVDLDGYDVGPGDEVVVLNPPTAVPFGERITKRCRARIRRAGLPMRLWTRAAAYFELTGLYEVGFDPKREPDLAFEPDVKAEADFKTEADLRAEQRLRTEPEPKAEPLVQAEPDLKAEPLPQAEPDPKPEPHIQAEPEHKAEPHVQAGPDREKEPKSKKDPKPKKEPEIKDASASKLEPNSNDEPDPKDEGNAS